MSVRLQICCRTERRTCTPICTVSSTACCSIRSSLVRGKKLHRTGEEENEEQEAGSGRRRESQGVPKGRQRV